MRAGFIFCRMHCCSPSRLFRYLSFFCARAGFDWSPWTNAYIGSVTSRWGAQLVNAFRDKCNGGFTPIAYLMGGTNGENCGSSSGCHSMFSIELSNGNPNWTSVGVMNVPARVHAVAVAISMVYLVIGGLIGGVPSAEVWRVSTDNKGVPSSVSGWTEVASLPSLFTPRWIPPFPPSRLCVAVSPLERFSI